MNNVKFYDNKINELNNAITNEIKILLVANGVDPMVGIDLNPILKSDNADFRDAITYIFDGNFIDLYYEDCVTYESIITKVWVDERNYVRVNGHFGDIQMNKRVIYDPSRLIDIYKLLIKVFEHFAVKQNVVYDFTLKDDEE